ncbi:tetratricopeptide repeat protein [Noviherbaspirillum sp. ST9]|uniref:tetratricopeptide repeat protein n=1 Tax=Noviherbaspirillum sp. ST9 TaxID=3401606 RepID=UPI003B587FE7
MNTTPQFPHTPPVLSAEEVRLLARTAHALILSADGDKREAIRFLERAASAGDRDSQLSLGLLLARMDIDGKRNDTIDGIANYKEAIRWLTLAADQGVEKAWYAISRIYQKAEFSQRSLSQSHAYLCKAASAGYHVAQRELGMLVWRTRKGDESRDVLALYWLHKAAAQGCGEAATRLEKLASRPSPSPWALEVQRQLAPHAFKVPLVVNARIALAAYFGLSLPEALLIDLAAADRGHCLLIDVRADYARGRRRLILVGNDDDRAEIDRIARAFEGVDCSPGAEGRYRQRLYRLKKLVSDWSAVQRLLKD